MAFDALEKEILSGHAVQIPEFLKDWLAKPKGNYVGGRWHLGSGPVFKTINPATEAVLAELRESRRSEVDFAVNSAQEAFLSGPWRKFSATEKSEVLREIGDLILRHRAPLALLETLDTGKPIRESYEGDILRSATNFHFFADLILSDKELHFESSGNLHSASRNPVGVVGLITPWNLPLYLETWKIAPCLAMGNACVLKPSELTPLTSNYFAELIDQSSLPKGIFNLIHGFGKDSAGEFLVSHPKISAISFTGETHTGRAIMKSASENLTKISFELGGKGASIVFADAPKESMQESLRAAFRNQGEICLACPRLFIEKKVYPTFVREFVDFARSIRVGNPLSYETQMGALIGLEHYEKVVGYLQDPQLKILCGGIKSLPRSPGYFIPPTVIEGLSLDHPISREEIFGPVVSLYSFESEEEVVRAVNDTPYGLSASIWTKDVSKANRVASALDNGLIWINCWFVRDLRVPFGGVKQSGIGREGGTHSLDFFSEWKSICHHPIEEVTSLGLN